MREIPLLLLNFLLALFLLLFGFFIVDRGGDPAIGSAIVMWTLSAIVVLLLVVPKSAPFIESIAKKDEAKRKPK